MAKKEEIRCLFIKQYPLIVVSSYKPGITIGKFNSDNNQL